MSKLPEKCPICGEMMEKGYIEAGAGGFSAPFAYWINWTGTQKERLATGFLQARLEAYRCPNCKIVLFSYEKEKE